jgi:tripartite-type tricarboxylate transporter receptor subunit TctC
VTPVPPGGSPDLVARLYASRLAETWGVPVIVENRPGGDGAIAVRAVQGSDDGHTLLVAPSGMLTILSAVRGGSVNLDDLAPVTKAATDYLAITVPASSPHNSLNDLLQDARLKPGSMNWFAPAGLPAIVFRELLRSKDVNAVFVPYKGGPDALRDLSEARIQAVLVPLATVLPLASSGKVRLIALSNAQRFPGAANVPTFAESNYGELEFEGVIGFLAPKALPEAVRQKIASDVRNVAAKPDISQSLLNMGQAAAVSSAEEFGKFLQIQSGKWGAIARQQNMAADNR